MLKPLGDKVLLRLVTAEDATGMTDSGIYIPDSEKVIDQQRIIVATGPDIKNKGLEKDVKVLLTALSMKERYEEGETVYEIVKETDILGIL